MKIRLFIVIVQKDAVFVTFAEQLKFAKVDFFEIVHLMYVRGSRRKDRGTCRFDIVLLVIKT